MIALAVLAVLLAETSYIINQKRRFAAGVLLALYICIIYCHTVIFRPFDELAQHNFMPFWSYKPILEGNVNLIIDCIVNVLMFVPVGFLLGCTFHNLTIWGAILFGACISVSIEALQFFFHRGFAEVDDVLHNALGCLIGYLLYRAVAWVVGNIASGVIGNFACKIIGKGKSTDSRK